VLPGEPPRPESRSSLTGWALAVFLLSALFVAWSLAARFCDNIDEGIYLDGGLRMAHGEMPYRDFFTYLGPGTFALLAILFKTLGTSLAVSRVPVVIDLALMTALVFVLVAKLAGRRAAAVTAPCFLAFQTFNRDFVVANHRWDSNALSFAAVACCFLLLEKPSRYWAFGSGVCAGLAVWTTISSALLGVLLFGWLLWDQRLRACAKTYAAGAGMVFVTGVTWLALHQALFPMIDGMIWSVHNYAGPNRAPYGLVVGGYGHIFRNSGALETLLIAVFATCITLPATLPVLNIAGWPLRLFYRPERRIAFLLACGAAMAASSWPRPDMTHLMYVAAPHYVLASVLLARTLAPGARSAIAGLFLLVAASETGFAVYCRLTDPSLATRVGVVHGKQADLAVLRTIESRVSANQTLFVFPYWPVYYFTTGARNPTRYSYLQPGMFPKHDEEEVLRTLSDHPPEMVVYRRVQPASYLTIWPSADPARLRMTAIENFLSDRYTLVSREGKFEVLQLRERSRDPAPSQAPETVTSP